MCVSSGYSLPLDAALHSAGVLDTGFFYIGVIPFQNG